MYQVTFKTGIFFQLQMVHNLPCQVFERIGDFFCFQLIFALANINKYDYDILIVWQQYTESHNT